MRFAAPMDWMCEPWILSKTGLTLAEHQERTAGPVEIARGIRRSDVRERPAKSAPAAGVAGGVVEASPRPLVPPPPLDTQIGGEDADQPRGQEGSGVQAPVAATAKQSGNLSSASPLSASPPLPPWLLLPNAACCVCHRSLGGAFAWTPQLRYLHFRCSDCASNALNQEARAAAAYRSYRAGPCGTTTPAWSAIWPLASIWKPRRR